MQALIWTERGRLELIEQESPSCRTSGEVKVKIELAGICGTDLAVIAGKEPGVPGIIRGHEAVGTVVETGADVSRVRVGDRVVIDPNQSCGECRFCRKGQLHLCIGRSGQGMPIAGLNLPGTFAPYFVTDESFVHRLPDGMSWEAAVLVEPLACVLHNFKVAGVTREDRVLVLGSGPMGLLCQIVGGALGCFTVGTEVNPYRLSVARRFSERVVLPEELGGKTDPPAPESGKYDVVIDTVGTQMALAEQWVERGGRIVPFGINGGYQYILTPTHYVQHAVKIIGAGEYLGTFEPALKFAADHPELASLVTRRYPLTEYEPAIQELLGYDFSTGARLPAETMKTVFVF
ncbi:alcohol dehydrogenase catalytic domain-containing protein [Paenibacillus sp. alder61]|uniref:Alcohol dehydrogenase catalytic domain-containing protein n=1 Tax=Paenibacillus faecis TaxID=862114 RepID=A0A5D0CNJ3_9BACL|nr:MULTISPECIES: alcohol dehydrogenase catalytic domain-containing protein [Paenibacillus]MCA1292416.1 alcohol dehydrogenase catalytic domain-containing protein [Paenibacillus sp. alder61]TYA11486.1 alcohol dehydrogenase catalytic domain-containing protein [Paenibacillus faecis]